MEDCESPFGMRAAVEKDPTGKGHHFELCNPVCVRVRVRVSVGFVYA